MNHDKSDSSKIKSQKAVHPQKKGQRAKKVPKRITETYLHNSGLYYLERFVASKNHFKTVMQRKVKRSCLAHKDQDYEECVKLVDALADKFEKMGLLNDALYTQGMVNSLRRKGLSQAGIINKMQMKGINRAQTLSTLQQLDSVHYDTEKEAEMNAALTLARKKRLGPYSIKDVEHMKALGVFARAGFSYDIAKTILEISLEDAEEIARKNFM